MKPRAVLDTTMIVSGIGYRGDDGQKILRLLAGRAFLSIRTPYLTLEWTHTLERLSGEGELSNMNWPNWIEWLKRVSLLVEEPRVRATVKRDPKDDPVLAAAVGGSAQYLVSYDRDLLDLGKPYGIECVRPHAFIRDLLAKP